jgi:hypothetical protein
VQRTTAREDLENHQRERALKRFRNTHIVILVSTLSVAPGDLQVKDTLRGHSERDDRQPGESGYTTGGFGSPSGNLFNAANLQHLDALRARARFVALMDRVYCNGAAFTCWSVLLVGQLGSWERETAIAEVTIPLADR